jgi:hypothetical protein
VKAVATRIWRLETKLVPQEDLALWRTAMILYERLRRCAQAAPGGLQGAIRLSPYRSKINALGGCCDGEAGSFV